MTTTDFPEANATLLQAEDGEKNPSAIDAYRGNAIGGSIDGAQITVVAWKPLPEELEELNKGGAVFLTCIGTLPGHTLQTSFHHATHF